MTRKIEGSVRDELLSRYRESGQRQKDFCESVGISVTSLQKWLRAEKPAGQLVEVPALRPRVEPRIEVEFSDGTILRVSGVSR